MLTRQDRSRKRGPSSPEEETQLEKNNASRLSYRRGLKDWPVYSDFALRWFEETLEILVLLAFGDMKGVTYSVGREFETLPSATVVR